jgi:hypothetical protein
VWAGILILCRERLLEVHLAIGACSAVSDAVRCRVMSDASDMPHGKASLSMGSEFGELLIKAMA